VLLLSTGNGNSVRKDCVKSAQTKPPKTRTRARDNSSEHNRRAKSRFNMREISYCQRIWWDALCDLRRQLEVHCRGSEPDKLRFQTGRLFKSLVARLPTKNNRLKMMRGCYLVARNALLVPGYDEPRRLHFEEIGALFTSVPSREPEAGQKDRDRSKLSAITTLLRSVASWMEAQESFGMWLFSRTMSVTGAATSSVTGVTGA